MHTAWWLLIVLVVGVTAWKEGRASVGDEMLAVVKTRQHVAVQQELLDQEFQRCVGRLP